MLESAKNQWRYLTTSSVPLPVRVALVVSLSGYLLTSGVLGFAIGTGDYDHLSAYYEIAYRFWNRANGANYWLPGFNPFLCGGRSLAADPQTPVYHPILFLVGILGPTWALRLEMLTVLLIGTVGVVRWLRWFGLSSSQTAWGTLLYMCGGAIVGKFRAGHVTLDFYFLYPLFLYLSYRLSENRGRRFRRLLALYCAAFAYAGLYKPNFFVYGLLPLLLEATVRSVLRRAWRPILTILIAIVVSGLVQSISALPAWDYFTRFPRPAEHPFVWAHIYSFFANLVLPLKAIPSVLYGEFLFLPHEANLFIGPFAFFFALLGLLRWRGKRAELYSLLWMLALSLGVGLGTTQKGLQLDSPFSWFSPWWPGFETIRVPVRFWTAGFFVFIVLSATGWRIVHSRKMQTAQWLLAVAPLPIFCLYHLLVITFPFQSSLSMPRQDSTFVQSHISDPTRPLSTILGGTGTIECLHNLEVYEAPDLRDGPMLDAFPTPLPSPATWENWSTVRVDSATPSGAEYRFNLNHSDFWRWTGTGAEVQSKAGERLSLRATAPHISGVLKFEQPFSSDGRRFWAAGNLFLLGLIFWAFRKKPIRRVGLTGSIAAGKSTLAGYFSENGIAVVDMDRIAAEVRAIPSVQKRLKSKFPDAWDDERAAVTGDRLRKIIQESPRKKEWFENFLHVQMRRRFEAVCALLEAQGATTVVCEGALLLRTGYAEQLDEIIFVDAPRALRLTRLQNRNPQWSRGQQEAWLDGEDALLISGPGGVNLDGYSPFHRVENAGDSEKLRMRAIEIMRSWDTPRKTLRPPSQKS